MKKRLRKKNEKKNLEKLIMTSVAVKDNKIFYHNDKILDEIKKYCNYQPHVKTTSPFPGNINQLYGMQMIKVSRINMLTLLSAAV